MPQDYLWERYWNERSSYSFFLPWEVVHSSCELSGDWLAGRFVEMTTRRRAIRMLLALEGWKAEHGELPNSLDELVGAYLDSLPEDPFTRETFRYFPKGLAAPVVQTGGHGMPAFTLDAESPFIWSGGIRVRPRRSDDSSSPAYFILRPRMDGWRRAEPLTEQEVWSYGWVFPIP